VTQNFDIEIHSVESQQILQLINSPLLKGNLAISRVPEGSVVCQETMAEKLLMVPFSSDVEIPAKRRDEEVQIARRLAMVSSRVYITSTNAVASIVPSPWFLQADSLLDTNRIDEALVLAEQASQEMDDMGFDAERLVCSLFPCPLIQFHETAYINQKAGFVLFRETLFENAFKLLEKANTDPRLIIHLFPPFEKVDISSIYMYSGVRDVLSTLTAVEQTGTFPPQ
jgi:hypothetical protein